LSKQGPLRYNRKIARYNPLLNRAGTDRRLQTQNQLETDINALSMDRGGRKRDHDAVASVGAAEGTTDELLARFRRSHDRLDRKEASIRVDKSQLYPDMDANPLRRLRHRGSIHGSDGSDKEDSDEEDAEYGEEGEESDEEEDDFEDDTNHNEEEMPDLVHPRRETTIEIMRITVNAINAFVLKIILFFNLISLHDRTSGTSARRISCSTS
jgi:hypothetical protein